MKRNVLVILMLSSCLLSGVGFAQEGGAEYFRQYYPWNDCTSREYPYPMLYKLDCGSCGSADVYLSDGMLFRETGEPVWSRLPWVYEYVILCQNYFGWGCPGIGRFQRYGIGTDCPPLPGEAYDSRSVNHGPVPTTDVQMFAQVPAGAKVSRMPMLNEYESRQFIELVGHNQIKLAPTGQPGIFRVITDEPRRHEPTPGELLGIPSLLGPLFGDKR
jgi:hypothetical protein